MANNHQQQQGGGGHHQEEESFSVTLAASAHVNLQDHHHTTGNANSISPHIIHAVSVTQPVQSWTVLRDHVDFLAMDEALGGVVSGLPSCAAAPALSPSGGHHQQQQQQQQQDVDAIVRARNIAQEWLLAVLTVPAVRESAVMRQFLCYGANVVPPQFEGLVWIDFTGATAAAAGGVEQQHQQQQQAAAPQASEMVIEDPFDFPFDDPSNGNDNSDEEPDDDDDSIDSDDNPNYLQGRYEPTQEPLTQSEIMEIQQDSKTVEMVEDVGSLARSMGASHLGRSLNLQKEMMSYNRGHGGIKMGEQALQGQQGGEGGVMGAAGNILGSAVGNKPMSSASSGGIGVAMAQAGATEAHVAGLGDSFHRTMPVSAPRLDSFKMVKVVGKGSFGKVFLVREKQTNEMFALKVLKKDNIIKRNQVEHTRTERSVLGYIKHPFIVGLNMAFQSKDKLYFVLDYCAGGELFFHLGKVGKFSELRSCFYAAEITLAIDHIHGLDIVYRDLKPENVLLDSRGHVRLTDFGLSKEGITGSSSGANSFCGTPEYLAPEILNRQGHGRAVDWWSLGALLYEMLTGLPPFYCRDREKLFEKIRRGTLEYPKYLSPRAMQILRGLLTKDPRRRLGSGPNDAEDIKSTDFFSELNWDKLMAGDVTPPWAPTINGSMDTSQFDHEFTNMPLNSPGAFQGHGFGAAAGDNVFEGFTFTDRTFYAPPGSKAS